MLPKLVKVTIWLAISRLRAQPSHLLELPIPKLAQERSIYLPRVRSALMADEPSPMHCREEKTNREIEARKLALGAIAVSTSPGRCAGYDNGWVVSLVAVPIGEFDNSIADFPNMKRFPGDASSDTRPEPLTP